METIHQPASRGIDSVAMQKLFGEDPAKAKEARAQKEREDGQKRTQFTGKLTELAKKAAQDGDA